jgi:arylformamidase
MGLIDISQPLSPATAVWPGDQPVKWDWTARIEDGSSVNLGAMTLSTHAGTHADAPLHVRAEGGTTDDFDLSAFVGPAEVVSVGDDAIHPRHVEDVDAQRILFKTSASARPPDDWPESVAALNPDTVTALAARDSVLIGTDAPSVDPLDSTELVAHHALIEAGIVNLEGLSLAGVEPGRYQLLALPLKVTGADAAPVRAILRT